MRQREDTNMTHHTLGIIGCGNMGGAIAHGVLRSPALSGRFAVAGHDLNESLRPELEKAGGVWKENPVALARDSSLVLLAVKPYQLLSMIERIRPALGPGKTLLSIAAGQPLSALRAALAESCPAVQVMPNTPALIGKGLFALCLDDPALSPESKNDIRELFTALGTVFILPEAKMNAFSAVAGCGPAYVYHMMDAVMEAAVTLGFTRQEATAMVCALFTGAAGMVETSGQAPAALHANVTSPAGMTIAGTNHLARTAVRGHIIDAILAADARGKAMEKE